MLLDSAIMPVYLKNLEIPKEEFQEFIMDKYIERYPSYLTVVQDFLIDYRHINTDFKTFVFNLFFPYHPYSNSMVLEYLKKMDIPLEEFIRFILQKYFQRNEYYTTIASLDKKMEFGEDVIREYVEKNNIPKRNTIPRCSKFTSLRLSERDEKNLNMYFKGYTKFRMASEIVKDTKLENWQINKYLYEHPEIDRYGVGGALDDYFDDNPTTFSVEGAMKSVGCSRQCVLQYMKDHDITVSKVKENRQNVLMCYFSKRHQFKDFDTLSQTLNIPKNSIFKFLGIRGIHLKPYKSGYYEIKPSKEFLVKLNV